jgi:hypothetical protein
MNDVSRTIQTFDSPWRFVMSNVAESDFREMDNWDTDQVIEFQDAARFRQSFRTLDQASDSRQAAIGTLVAEGDSWFQYSPAGTDILACLRNHHDYDIDEFAKGGDTLENMIYGTDITSEFNQVPPSLKRVLKRMGELKPKVFLFSGGGNDIAGETLESYLNHQESGLTTLRVDYMNAVIQTTFRKYFEDLIRRGAEVSPDTYIIIHGYGYPKATGKGVKVLGVNFSGPWILPAFAKKRVSDKATQQAILDRLIDTYNDMLQGLMVQHPKFRYVDLRGMLDRDQDWANELHPKNSAFARIAKRIHEEIQTL